ncbi:MAG TPA: hypothetical protein VMT78_06460, partial [Terriglobia bacterium]|nr:hypothetical protein [Terriglobia bacterium]
MKAARQIVFGIFLTTLLISNISGQNPSELGNIQGRVTRLGTDDGFSGVQITLEGGVSPQALQSVMNSAAGAGIVVTPPPGATAAELTQLLSESAATRGLPVGQPAIQNLVNNAIGTQNWPSVMTDSNGRFSFPGVRPGRYTVRS